MLISCARTDDSRGTDVHNKNCKILMIVFLAGVAAYALAGFLLAPHLVRYWIENSISTQPGRHLIVEGVLVNPFTLFISLTNVTLIDHKNKPLVSIGRIETHSRIMSRLRGARGGRDADVRDLRVTGPANGQASLTIPLMSVTALNIAAAEGAVSVASARVHNPELRIARDAVGELRLPAWLVLPHSTSPAVPVRFEALAVSGGIVQFGDHTLSPVLTLAARDVVGYITRRDVGSAAAMAADFRGRFGEIGNAEVIVEWQPSHGRTPTAIDVALHQIELSALSPYFLRIAGRGIVAGTGSLTFHYERRDSAVRTDNRLIVDGLQLGDAAVTNTGSTLPLELAIALVTDNRDRINISIPVPHGGIDIDSVSAIADGLTDYIADLAAAPFDMLARLAGRQDEDLSSLAFPPGSAELTASTAEKIQSLTRALEQRPLLSLRVWPAYDPATDRDAIAEQQIRLHVILATSTNPRGAQAQTRLDFDDMKVREILDEFAATRLQESRRYAISGRFKDHGTSYYEAVYDALVDNEKVSDTALRRLARFRARSIIDVFTTNGVDGERLLFTDVIETRSSDRDAIVTLLEVLP